jgi:hypothetical protein
MAKGYKTGGRTAGTPNRITSLVRENLSTYIIECINSIDFNNLEDSDKVRLALGMLQYVIPKRKALEDLREEQPKEVTIQFIDSNGVDISHQYQKEIETMKNSDETDRGLAMDMHNLLRGDESKCIVNEG